MACHWGADVLVEYAAKGYDMAKFLQAASNLCRLVDISSKEVCKGMVNNVGRQVRCPCPIKLMLIFFKYQQCTG